MKRRIRIILGLSGIVFWPVAHAAMPVWTFAPVTGFPSQITVNTSGSAVVKYTVTNQSHKMHTLRMKPIQGVSATGCDSGLGYQQSCTLTLNITGSTLAGNVTGGPVLCDAGNASQCYQPSAVNQLRITKSTTNTTTISTDPSSVSITQGGNSQTVTITNTGAVEAYNVSAVVNVPDLGVTVTGNTCPSVLPHGATGNTCQINIVSGNTTGSTSVAISGTNTNMVSEPVTVNAVALTPIEVTGGSTMLLYTNDPNAVGWMVIKNNSSTETAKNIQANFSNTALNGHVNQDVNDCVSVLPGGSCTLRYTFTGSQINTSAEYPVSGNNTTQVIGKLAVQALPANGISVGDNFPRYSSSPIGKFASLNVVPSGGNACGTTASTLYLVVPNNSYPLPNEWGGDGTATGATDITDGNANTQLITKCLSDGSGCASSPPNPLIGVIFFVGEK